MRSRAPITSLLFAAYGVCALIIGLSGNGMLIGAGVGLLLCAAGVFWLPSAAMIGGGIIALLLLGQHAPLLTDSASPAPVSAMILTVGGVVTAIAAVIGLGPLLGTSGGC